MILLVLQSSYLNSKVMLGDIGGIVPLRMGPLRQVVSWLSVEKVNEVSGLYL